MALWCCNVHDVQFHWASCYTHYALVLVWYIQLYSYNLLKFDGCWLFGNSPHHMSTHSRNWSVFGGVVPQRGDVSLRDISRSR